MTNLGVCYTFNSKKRTDSPRQVTECGKHLIHKWFNISDYSHTSPFRNWISVLAVFLSPFTLVQLCHTSFCKIRSATPQNDFDGHERVPTWNSIATNFWMISLDVMNLLNCLKVFTFAYHLGQQELTTISDFLWLFQAHAVDLVSCSTWSSTNTWEVHRTLQVSR